MKRKIKREFIFEHLVYTNYDLVLNSSRDWSSYNLNFDWSCFFFLCHPSISPLSTRLLGVHDRCHARLLLEHSAEGSLGYRWFIRHFGDIHCRWMPPNLYLHHQSIGFEMCRSWHYPLPRTGNGEIWAIARAFETLFSYTLMFQIYIYNRVYMFKLLKVFEKLLRFWNGKRYNFFYHIYNMCRCIFDKFIE